MNATHKRKHEELLIEDEPPHKKPRLTTYIPLVQVLLANDDGYCMEPDDGIPEKVRFLVPESEFSSDPHVIKLFSKLLDGLSNDYGAEAWKKYSQPVFDLWEKKGYLVKYAYGKFDEPKLIVAEYRIAQKGRKDNFVTCKPSKKQ